MELQVISVKIESHMERMALERDRIDDFISELEGLRETCDEAYCALRDARDKLSEIV